MLSRVEIKRFRSCEDVVLTNLSGLQALVGRNGAGKTNVLRAIEWASKTAVSTQPVAVDMAQFLLRAVFPDVTLFFETSAGSYVYSVAQVSITPKSGRPQFSLGLTESLVSVGSTGERVPIVSRAKETVTLHGRQQELVIGASTPMLKALMAILPKEDQLHAQLMDVALYLEGVRYYPLEKLDTSPRFVQGAAYQAWFESMGASPQFTDDSVVMRLIELNLHRPAEFDEILDLVGPNGLNIISKMAVEEFRFPVAADEEDRGGEPPPPDFYMVSFWPAGFDHKKKSQMQFGFDDLSYGTKRLLTIITSIIFDRSSVLLIEQPEDGIHIGLLNKLTPMLRAYSENMQFVLASHSRDVLDRFHPDELRFVSLNDGKSVVRALTAPEVEMAESFIEEEGPLSDFIETLGED